MSVIKFVDKISDNLEEKMRRDLVTYEKSHLIDVNYKRFSLVLIDNIGEAIGVLNVFTAFAEIYIDDIWVDGLHRSKGYGRELIEALENKFKGQGFNNINLVTNNFQAPEFYKKCGFELEFIRKNLKNPKLNKYFFVKYFDDQVQTQGIYK